MLILFKSNKVSENIQPYTYGKLMLYEICEDIVLTHLPAVHLGPMVSLAVIYNPVGGTKACPKWNGSFGLIVYVSWKG